MPSSTFCAFACLSSVAGFLVLQLVGRLHAQLGAGFLVGLVGLHPVDDGERVVGLRIVGIELSDLLVILLGLIELLLLEVQRGDALQAVDLLLLGRMLVQHLLEDIDGLLGVAIVVGRIGAGNVLLGMYAVAK